MRQPFIDLSFSLNVKDFISLIELITCIYEYERYITIELLK